MQGKQMWRQIPGTNFRGSNPFRTSRPMLTSLSVAFSSRVEPWSPTAAEFTSVLRIPGVGREFPPLPEVKSQGRFLIGLIVCQPLWFRSRFLCWLAICQFGQRTLFFGFLICLMRTTNDMSLLSEFVTTRWVNTCHILRMTCNTQEP